MVLALPELEGKYEILELVGRGGMGAVYKVRHRLLDELRVVKIVRPRLTGTEEFRERFLREARLATRLRHPNIVQLHDFSIDADGNAFMVLEYVQGRTLKEILREHGHPSLGLTLQIALQTLSALAHLHRHRVVHRDVSPDNLMLSASADGPAIQLIDLGIAKDLDVETDITKTRDFVGKLKYSAPEIFRHGSQMADRRSDLYSFGIVLYELLTGRFPIVGTDHASLMAGHLLHGALSFSEADPDGLVPVQLREAVLRSLNKEPDQRFGSAEDMSVEIRRALDAIGDPKDPSREARRLLDRGTTDLQVTRSAGTTQGGLDEVFRVGDQSENRALQPEDQQPNEALDRHIAKLREEFRGRE